MEKIKLVNISPWRYPKNIITNIKSIVKSIRTFYERGRYGISSNWDCWDLDMYMTNIFKNGISEFRQNTCGYPANLTEKEWDNILARMEELITIIQIDGIDSEKANAIYEKYRGCDDWEDHYKEWIEALDEWDEYIQESLDELCDLMKEWFFHLWW